MSLTKEDLKAIKHLVEDVVDTKLEEQNTMISQSFTAMQESIDNLNERMDETLDRVRNIEGHVEELYKRTETNDDERTVIGRQVTRSDERLDDHENRITKLEELTA